MNPYGYELSREVRLYSPKKGVDGFGNLTVECSAKSRVSSRNRHPVVRRVTVTALGGSKTITRAPGVKVSCTCEDHCFTWEVALHRHGAADIIYSNGEAPIMKNPSMIPLVCKHVLRTLMAIRAKGM